MTSRGPTLDMRTFELNFPDSQARSLVSFEHTVRSLHAGVQVCEGLELLPIGHLAEQPDHSLRGGWPVLAIGVLSISSGFLYTAGPRPLGYLGLGDFFVLVFFGPVAVGGTYFVQALEVSWVVLVAGLAPGLLAVALLSVNNLRDIEEDESAGKLTLAVRFGAPFARWEYIISVLGAAFIPVVLFLSTGLRPWTLMCLVIVPIAAPVFKRLLMGVQGRELIPMLGSTAGLSILYAILFSLTWVI